MFQPQQPGQPSSTTPGAAAAGAAPMPVLLTLPEVPPVPTVLSVADRQVWVENPEAPPSGYVLARRWMRNDPDTDVETLPQPANTRVLPRPLDLRPETAPAAPPPLVDPTNYDPDQAVMDFKRHWVRLRRFGIAKRLHRLERYRDRLKLVTAPQPITLQQVQAAAAQQAAAAAAAQAQAQQQPAQDELAQVQPAAQSHSQQQHSGGSSGGVILQLPPHVLAKAAAAQQQQQQQPQQQQQQQPPAGTGDQNS